MNFSRGQIWFDGYKNRYEVWHVIGDAVEMKTGELFTKDGERSAYVRGILCVAKDKKFNLVFRDYDAAAYKEVKVEDKPLIVETFSGRDSFDFDGFH
jgi:hypothetical protein